MFMAMVFVSLIVVYHANVEREQQQKAPACSHWRFLLLFPLNITLFAVLAMLLDAHGQGDFRVGLSRGCDRHG
jgi:uncharacterized membrane protein